MIGRGTVTNKMIISDQNGNKLYDECDQYMNGKCTIITDIRAGTTTDYFYIQ
jgi:hypothetical protein